MQVRLVIVFSWCIVLIDKIILTGDKYKELHYEKASCVTNKLKIMLKIKQDI